jgi:spermidine synthase
MIKIKISKYGIILFITGFAALVYEIVFIKTLSLILGQSIYAFSVMLAAFMFGIGIGSLFASKLKGEPLWLFALTQISIAAYSIVFIPLLNNLNIPSFFISRLPFYLHSGAMILLSLAILIIPTSLMGLSFPVLLKHVMEEKNDKSQIGQLFAYNTLGGLFGSLAAGFIFLPGIGVSATLIIAALINLSVAVSIKTKNFLERLVTAIACLIAVILFTPEIDPHSVGSFYTTSLHLDYEDFAQSIRDSRESTEVIFSDFDVYGHVFIKQAGNEKFLYINGKPDAGTSMDVTTELLIGYIPMFMHENPKKVAVIGLGAGLTAGAALQFDIDKLDVYEINPAVVEANKHFEEESHHVLSDPKTKLILGDARRKLSVSGETYDVIISEPSNPWVEGEGFLFTNEFYKIVDEHLNKKGIFLQWIGAYDFTAKSFDILLNTLNATFPQIQIWSDGYDFYIVSSKEPKTCNYNDVVRKMKQPVIASDMKLIGYYDQKIMNPEDIFFSYFVAYYKATGVTELNTDDNSIIEFSTARFRGETVDHVKRIVKEPVKTLPVNLTRADFDIEFETDLPYFSSKYIIIQMGLSDVITKQIVFKDDVSTLFLQTQLQPEPPTLEQAQKLASNFNAVVTKSENNLYSFEGEGSSGLVGYCADVKKSFVAYSTTGEKIIVHCRQESGK